MLNQSSADRQQQILGLQWQRRLRKNRARQEPTLGQPTPGTSGFVPLRDSSHDSDVSSDGNNSSTRNSKRKKSSEGTPAPKRRRINCIESDSSDDNVPKNKGKGKGKTSKEAEEEKKRKEAEEEKEEKGSRGKRKEEKGR